MAIAELDRVVGGSGAREVFAVHHGCGDFVYGRSTQHGDKSGECNLACSSSLKSERNLYFYHWTRCLDKGGIAPAPIARWRDPLCARHREV